jgi:hypothetical protein
MQAITVTNSNQIPDQASSNIRRNFLFHIQQAVIVTNSNQIQHFLFHTSKDSMLLLSFIPANPNWENYENIRRKN